MTTYTDPKDWTFAEMVEDGGLNTYLRDNLLASYRVLAWKTADETVTNSTTLQNDDHLFFAMGTNEVWLVSCTILIEDESGSTSDNKIAFTVPASTVFSLSAMTLNTAGSAYQMSNWDTSGTAVAIFGDSPALAWEIAGVVATAGTSGNFQVQWAQNSLNNSDVNVMKNSNIMGVRLI